MNLKFIGLLFLLFIASCTVDDNCKDVVCLNGQVCIDGTCIGENTNIIVTSNITENTTWVSNEIYELAGRITVESGVTLTIQAGTIIKGQAGTGANATALLVARGGKIMAEGTYTYPIIFTSVADEITNEMVAEGNFVSPNLESDVNGLWGGVIILGNAPISASENSSNISEIQIEGIPTTDANGLYGGNVPNDNSGVLRYVSIRHGGANIGSGNEINGLTLGGVGSETIIDNIEIIGNQDDGIEFFGGTVNVNNILVVNAGDDAIDTDQAWAGTLDNFIVICGSNTDHALEIDGPEGTLLDGHIVRNGSIKGDVNSELGDFRKNARGTFSNIFFFGFPSPLIDGRGDLSLSSGSDITFLNNVLSFENLEIDTTGMGVIDLNQIFKSGTDIHTDIVSSNSVGVNKIPFIGWTWANQSGLLFDF
tara:strand:- start:4176 stop:5444 length:1269 start_codon:yes stop_codon:yes gene_type:complete